MKKFNIYKGNIDKTWYNSSNIVYSECIDRENEYKIVRVTFNNGRTYEYSDVTVQDYLRFRDSKSQGKALNSFIKKYKYEELDGIDLESLNDELEKLMTIDFYFQFDENGLVIKNKKEEEIKRFDNEMVKNDDFKSILNEILIILNIKFKFE